MERRLAYSPEFKRIIRAHPGVIRKFAEAYKSRAEEHLFDGGSIKRIRPQSGSAHCGAWEVEVGGKAFFVKESKVYYCEQDGFSQFGNLQKLKAIETPKIKVATPHLGLDMRGKTSFLVLDRIDLPLFSSVEESKNMSMFFPDWAIFRKSPLQKLAASLGKFAKKAREKFGLVDIFSKNAFCDEGKIQLIVFDPCK